MMVKARDQVKKDEFGNCSAEFDWPIISKAVMVIKWLARSSYDREVLGSNPALFKRTCCSNSCFLSGHS